MKSLKQYIIEATQSEEIRSKIKFTIWTAQDVTADWLASNNDYQKIECKYDEDELKINFLLGFKDNVWCLWAGKPGVVNYTDDPYKVLDTSDFAEAVNLSIDKCVALIEEIKADPENWVQYYVEI